jgi:hypothetical protein
MRVLDVQITEIFEREYTKSPTNVQKKVDKGLRMVSKTGEFPNGWAVHLANGVDYWIARITPKHGSWRLLFTYDEYQGIVIFCRLLNHDDMKVVLR